MADSCGNLRGPKLTRKPGRRFRAGTGFLDWFAVSLELQPPRAGGVLLPNTKGRPIGEPMEKKVTPVEARSGVISGRIVTVLAGSFGGAVAALIIAWLVFGFH